MSSTVNPPPTPPTAAIARVSEFLRQWDMRTLNKTDGIYGIHIDPDGGTADLLASDLAALLAALGAGSDG